MLQLQEIERTFPEIRSLRLLPVPASGQKVVLEGTFHGKRVALKLVKRTGDGPHHERTMREVAAVTRLRSAYVPTVHDHGVRELGGRDRLYIVEEFITGKNYRDVLEACEADTMMVLRLGEALLNACADFEAADLVHRDIKPENIMIGDDGKIWIIDFGIVRLLDEESLTATSANFGPCTLGYGAPEQLKNVKPQINVRADLFSVGIVLHESLAGSHPYRRPGLNQLDVVREMQQKDPPKLEGVDDELARFVATMTSRFPSRRPQASAEAIEWFQPIPPPTLQGKTVKLYLQFGHGMMGHSKTLLKEWGGDGGAILSPRDLERAQLERVGAEITGLGAEALIDPQCYSRAADHHRLTEHEYWKELTKHQTQGLIGGRGADELMDALEDLNTSVGCDRRIVPGLLAEEVDADWLAFQNAFIEAARRKMSAPLLATIAVSATALKDENQVETLIEQAESWPVDGFYVVAETPEPYLVGEPVWLANLLILASGLKLLGKYVVVGYCSHQQLGLAAANVDAMASGTYLNVRSFDNGKFFAPEGEQIKKKSTWYYCPHALSEFRIPFLDVAQVKGVLGSLGARAPISGKWGKPLFSGAQPTSVNWREPDAFRHYLDSLKIQCDEATQASFDDAVAFHSALLTAAENELSVLHANGVKGSTRDFADYFDVCESAMALHEDARGHRLRKNWRA